MNPIIDFIISVKNGYMSKKDEVIMQYSSFKLDVAQKLVNLGFIGQVKVIGGTKKELAISLIYKDGEAAMTGVKIYSKSGKREYVSYKKLKPVLGGLGYSILSTPQGVLTNKEARKSKTGGELLFSIW